jgi:hypothetical protein
MSPFKILLILSAIVLVGSSCSSHHHKLHAKMPARPTLMAAPCDLPSASEVELDSIEEIVMTK